MKRSKTKKKKTKNYFHIEIPSFKNRMMVFAKWRCRHTTFRHVVWIIISSILFYTHNFIQAIFLSNWWFIQFPQNKQFRSEKKIFIEKKNNGNLKVFSGNLLTRFEFWLNLFSVRTLKSPNKLKPKAKKKKKNYYETYDLMKNQSVTKLLMTPERIISQ